MQIFILVLWASLSFTPSSHASAALSPEGKLLSELVSISSGTADTQGVNRVQDRTAKALKAMGFEIKFYDNPTGAKKSGKALVATLKGKSTQYITLVGHADTVFEKWATVEVMNFETVPDEMETLIGLPLKFVSVHLPTYVSDGSFAAIWT